PTLRASRLQPRRPAYVPWNGPGSHQVRFPDRAPYPAVSGSTGPGSVLGRPREPQRPISAREGPRRLAEARPTPSSIRCLQTSEYADRYIRVNGFPHDGKNSSAQKTTCPRFLNLSDTLIHWSVYYKYTSLM